MLCYHDDVVVLVLLVEAGQAILHPEVGEVGAQLEAVREYLVVTIIVDVEDVRGEVRQLLGQRGQGQLGLLNLEVGRQVSDGPAVGGGRGGVRRGRGRVGGGRGWVYLV